MRDRATALGVALALGLAMAACSGGAEKNVVNQYFGALQAGDTGTLTSFAMVQFDKPVQDYSITGVSPEARVPAPLPELAKKATELEGQQKANERAYRAWGNDLAVYPKLDELKAARSKGAKLPPALASYAEKYDTFQAKDRELKKAVTEAKAAVEREKRNVALSVGNVEDIESLTGDMISKDVDLELTLDGAKKPYVMTLRKYEMAGGSGPRMVSRWVVQSITPKS